MDNQDPVVSEEIQEPKAPESPAVEPVTPAETQGETEDADGKGANQRIRELNQRAKVAEEQVKSLSDKIAELTQSGEVKPFTPDVQPGEEISPERYQQDVTKTADSLVQLRMKQYEAETKIKSESAEVIKYFPQLNPDKPEFDQELSDTITEAVEAHIRMNPYKAEVKRFVSKLMKPYQKAIEKEVGEATANIAKQVTEAAVRPTQVIQTEKNAGEKSIAQLEKELGIVYS
jgi:hypothetical protein